MVIKDSVFVPEEVATLAPFAEALGAPAIHGAAHLVGGDAPDVALACAVAIWAPLYGHSCADLRTVGADVEREVARQERSRWDVTDDDAVAASAPLPWPDAASWRAELADHPAVAVVDRVDLVGGAESADVGDRPLVLYGDRIYTQRQWLDELSVATALRRLATGGGGTAVNIERLDEVLETGSDQHRAASAAVQRRLAVVVGGPGTGKTYTIARLLAVLLTDPECAIGLAAPTGKAAARLTESIQAAAAELPAEWAPVVGRLQELQATTVHRLLGPRPDHRTRFRHHADNPVPYDVVVVDEVSMVPLPLMARLLEAVDAGRTNLVLVGDPDQLVSIEVGVVLRDIVAGAAVDGSPLAPSVVRLTRQHRTESDSPIHRLADAIRSGDEPTVTQLLTTTGNCDAGEQISASSRHSSAGGAAAPGDCDVGEQVSASSRHSGGGAIGFLALDGDGVPGDEDVAAALAAVDDSFAAMVAAAEGGDVEVALRSLAAARILCGHRDGPFGVSRWNRHIEARLGVAAQASAINPAYIGRPLLATRNDIRTGVSNGDTGVIVDETVDGRNVRRAVFDRGGGDVRRVGLAELDEPLTAYAVTIHRTQGSEFDTVVIIHPPVGSPLIGRELLYTAVTRARQRVVVVGSLDAVIESVRTPVRRVSGLGEFLAEPTD